VHSKGVGPEGLIAKGVEPEGVLAFGELVWSGLRGGMAVIAAGSETQDYAAESEEGDPSATAGPSASYADRGVRPVLVVQRIVRHNVILWPEQRWNDS
jgi:hypothetical protein